jgi:Na+/H+ antiporter NhaC
VAADVAVDPTHTHLPLCPLHAMTGLSCPLCGSLRAVDELVRGHLGTALRDNVLLVAALPVVVVLWLAWAGRGTGISTGISGLGRSTAVRIAVVSVLVGFAVVRNLPFATALRP